MVANLLRTRCNRNHPQRFPDQPFLRLVPETTAATYNADVAKLVCRGHGVIVQQAGCGHPAGVRVVGEDDQLVFVTSVTDPEQAFLNVRHDHSLANGVDAGHQVWNVLRKEEA